MSALAQAMLPAEDKTTTHIQNVPSQPVPHVHLPSLLGLTGDIASASTAAEVRREVAAVTGLSKVDVQTSLLRAGFAEWSVKYWTYGGFKSSRRVYTQDGQFAVLRRDIQYHGDEGAD